MSTPGLRDAADAVMVATSEEAWAMTLRAQGHRVILQRGRWWLRPSRGYCQPVHQMARLTSAEAKAPHLSCTAYRAALTEPAASSANGTMPLHLLVDPQAYRIEDLSANRRYHLRRSQRLVEYVQLTSRELLETEGHEVFLSAQQRTQNPYRAMWSKEKFVEQYGRWFESDTTLVLAGLIDGRLGGYIAGHAVDHAAYIDVVDVATEVLQTHISTGLHYEFIRACARNPQIREIMHSPHEPEDRALGTFKSGVGFPVVHVPTRVRVFPPLAYLLRRRHPLKYYRLTGRLDHPLEATTEPTEA